MNSTFKNLTKNYSILTISNIGSIVFGILSTPIILHNLSIDFFGVYTIVLSLLVITQVFNNMLSINVIGPKIIAMSNSDGLTKKKKYYYTAYILYSLITSIISSVLIIIILNYYYDISQYYLLSLVFFYNIFLNINNLAANLALIQKKFVTVAGIPLFRSFFKLAFVVTFLVILKVDSIIIMILLLLFVEILLFLFYFKNVLSNLTFKLINKSLLKNIDLKEDVKKSSYNFVSVLMVNIYSITIIALMNKSLGLEILAVFGIINGVIKIVASFAKTFESVLLPNLVEWVNDDAKMIKINQISKYATIVFILAIIVFNFFSPTFIRLYAGEKYLQYSKYFRIASITLIIIPLQISQRATIYALGKTNIIFKSVLYGTSIKTFLVVLFYFILRFEDLSLFLIINFTGDFVYYLSRKKMIYNKAGYINNEKIHSKNN